MADRRAADGGATCARPGAAVTPMAGRGFSSAFRRVLPWATVAALLAFGFLGYLHPDMRLDWAALAQMCGLR